MNSLAAVSKSVVSVRSLRCSDCVGLVVEVEGAGGVGIGGIGVVWLVSGAVAENRVFHPRR